MEAHNRAKETYLHNLEEIGQHMTKPTHVLIAIERHDAGESVEGSKAKDRYLWVKGRRVSCPSGPDCALSMAHIRCEHSRDATPKEHAG